MARLFVVAVSQKEADELGSAGYGYHQRVTAEGHLLRVRAAPTDPFYAQQYKIFEVARPTREDTP